MSARTAFSAAALAAALLPAAAAAQSSLGFTAGALTLGATSVESGDARGFAEGWLDVAITGSHGLQFDLGLEETAAGTLAHAGAHLYLAPKAGQKYGLFAVVSDMDGMEFTVGAVGAEGIFALGERTALELRGGVGIARRPTAPTSLDFIFVGAGVTHEFSPALSAGLYAEAAEFDEIGLRANGYTIRFEAELRPGRGPLALTAGIGISGLDGPDGMPSESFVSLGLTYSFGGRGPDPSRRAFRRPDPYAPLALRGLF